MHRLTVVLLAAVDAAIAVAVGIAATLAPLTLLWVVAFGGVADWAALWPAAASIWQLGHAVPLDVELAGAYVAAVGVDPSAESFALSLGPLAFAAFTAIFAARSGIRASRAEAWVTGVVTGSVVVAALSALVALTSTSAVVTATTWQAVLHPTLFFLIPGVIAAVATEWREAGSGAIARLRDRIESAPHGWGLVPALVARGAAVAVMGLLGAGALVLAVGIFTRGTEIIGLYEAGNVDLLGAIVITLAQLAYLPTLAIWGLAFVAGPGFSLGAGTAVSPAATQVGVIPGIPVLGAVPESTTPWLLLLALLPVALGALAGWIARSRLIALEKDAVARGIGPQLRRPDDDDPIAARLAVTGGIAVVAAAATALLASLAAGSMGPGRLTAVGPEPGAVALAVGLEVCVGAGILLLAPRRREDRVPEAAELDPQGPVWFDTEPLEPLRPPDEHPTGASGTRL
jgi:hypothetical protein